MNWHETGSYEWQQRDIRFTHSSQRSAIFLSAVSHCDSQFYASTCVETKAPFTLLVNDNHGCIMLKSACHPALASHGEDKSFDYHFMKLSLLTFFLFYFLDTQRCD